MNRQKLIKQLLAYQPWDDEEVEVKEKMLNFAQTNPQCFDRTVPDHFTGSVWVIIQNFG